MDSSQGGLPTREQRASADSSQSPTETRQPTIAGPSHTPRTDNGLSESFQSTDTVRRRPEGYGSIQLPTGTTGDPADEQARPRRSNSTNSPQRIHERTKQARSRKPPMIRRPSSNTPYRGIVFSAEDEPSEVQADAAEAAERSRDGSGYGTRRRTQGPTNLSRVQSFVEENRSHTESHSDGDSVHSDEEEDQESPADDENIDDDSRSDISDAESFTLKDRQQAINQTHPFGIRVWKPALYKKDRSIQKFAEGDIHSSPGGRVSKWLLLFNLVWTIVFGWWMATFAAFGAVVCLLFAAAPSGREYGRVLWGLAGYLLYPFGQVVRLEKDEAYASEDQDEGRSITEYEQWQQGDLEYGRLFFGPDRNRSIVGRSRQSIDSVADETDSLLGRRDSAFSRRRGGDGEDLPPGRKRRLFGRGEWNIGRVIFFVFFYCLITPSLLIVSLICWFLVFWIPMGKVTWLLFSHLRRHPLAMSFDSDLSQARYGEVSDSTILLCTYRAVGSKYWKYTVDGTNIFLINLMAIVVFVIFDWAVLDRILGLETKLTSPAFLFTGGLFSIIPLAYFIGQAVASISAQSSMGVGAAVNAFFATIVEVFLYCIALNQGKGPLVEGSIVGSIFAGILFLPGISMCFGALKRKTQRFNAKSAGVTSTMLLFAVVGAFGPTLFYQIYGTHELNCLDCEDFDDLARADSERDCRRCYFSQTPAINDRFYIEAVKPYCYIAAAMLFFSYLIGLWFTLRTHAAVIWNAEADEKRHEDHMHSSVIRTSQHPTLGESTGSDIRDSHLYKRILGQSLKQAGVPPRSEGSSQHLPADKGPNGATTSIPGTPHIIPPKNDAGDSQKTRIRVPGLSEADNNMLVREVAEIAATAATVAHRERLVRKASAQGVTSAGGTVRNPSTVRAAVFPDEPDVTAAETATAHGGGHGGHDAPNWSRSKSTIILLGATLLYAVIAEILVDTVDVILESSSIDQKFLGITLFALVPNTTEFLNAISFAMNGNIALSMEIGSAYALQVCLLQIPCLVLYSALWPNTPASGDASSYSFSLIFPQWDMVTVILCVFLLSYVYGEGKSNYFKGSILVLTYMVVIIGYFFSGYSADAMGTKRFDTMGADGQFHSYKTVGRTMSGVVF